jgi:uncharacterized delta-60 repeat protein
MQEKSLMKLHCLLVSTAICVTLTVFSQELIQDYRVQVAGNPFHRLTVDSEGFTYVFGTFDQLNGKSNGRLLKLDASGNLVSGFNELFADGEITSVGVQSDKKILICGNFTKINDALVGSVLRLHPDGTIDNTFSCSLTKATKLRIQSTGKIIVLDSDGVLERLNANGSTDNTFQFQNFIYSNAQLAIGANDAIYFANYNVVFRLTPDGADDATFATAEGADVGSVEALTVQSDGKVLVGGYFNKFNNVASKSIVRLNSNGQVDGSFVIGVGPDGSVYQIVERANHNLLIAGQFTTFNGQYVSLVELKPDGSLFRTVATVNINNITSMFDVDGKITIGGSFRTVNGIKVFGVSRFLSNYTLDQSFLPKITFNNANGRDLLVGEDFGAIITGDYEMYGIFNDTEFVSGKAIKVDFAGKLDESFHSYFSDGMIYSGVILPNKKVILNGVFNGQGWLLIRLNADGTKDETFSTGTGPTLGGNVIPIYGMKQIGDRIYLSGQFSHFNGAITNGLVAINSDGVVQQTYPALPSGSYVWRIEKQSDGKLILIGEFELDGEIKRVVRLNTDGSVDQDFHQISGLQMPTAIAVDSTDHIYLTGESLHPDGTLLKHVVKLDPDGQVNATFNTGSGFSDWGYIVSIAALPDDRIAVGGYFNYVQGTLQPGFAILDKDGNNMPLPNPFFGKSSAVVEMSYKNGQLFLTGRFRTPDYKDSYGVTRVSVTPIATPEPPANLVVVLKSAGKSQVTWSDHSDDEFAFVLERAVGEASLFVPIDTVSSNVTTSEDNIQREINYRYRVRAMNIAGYSDYSNTDELLWQPSPEGNLTLSIPPSVAAQTNLTFSGTILYHTGYIIERSTESESAFLALDTVALESTTFMNSINPNTQYRYRVKAFNAHGFVVSNVVETSWRPAPAGEITAAIEAELPGNAVLIWTHTISHHTGFIIQRSSQFETGFVAIDTVATEVLTYTDITDGRQSFHYKIVAYNANGTVSSNTISMLVTDVENPLTTSMKAYPNPVRRNVFIDASTITDLAGKWKLIHRNGTSTELFVWNVKEKTVEFDLGNLADGFYVLQFVSQSGKAWRAKIIKQ